MTACCVLSPLTPQIVDGGLKARVRAPAKSTVPAIHRINMAHTVFVHTSAVANGRRRKPPARVYRPALGGPGCSPENVPLLDSRTDILRIMIPTPPAQKDKKAARDLDKDATLQQS